MWNVLILPYAYIPLLLCIAPHLPKGHPELKLSLHATPKVVFLQRVCTKIQYVRVGCVLISVNKLSVNKFTFVNTRDLWGGGGRLHLWSHALLKDRSHSGAFSFKALNGKVICSQVHYPLIPSLLIIVPFNRNKVLVLCFETDCFGR